MGPVKCEISLDKLSKIYFPGETVKGTVSICLKSATKISTMDLHLIGIANFKHQDRFEICHEVKHLEMNKILPSGTEKFPISWTLLPNTIPTFGWKGGSTNYHFLAEVRLKNRKIHLRQFSENKAKSAQVPVEIHNFIDLNTLDIEEWRERDYNASFLAKGGGGHVSMNFVINRRCFVPGELVKFNCSVTHVRDDGEENPTMLEAVQFNLEEEVICLIDREKKNVNTTLLRRFGPVSLLDAVPPRRLSNANSMMNSNSVTKTWEDSIKIPNCCQSTPLPDYPDYSTLPLVSVRYYLNMKASLCRKNVVGYQYPWPLTCAHRIRIPLIIGIIPLEQPLLSDVHMESILSNRILDTELRSNGTDGDGNESEDEFYEVDSGHFNYLDFDIDILTNTQLRLGQEVEDRPETPPPTYEEAILVRNRRSFSTRREMDSPPEYTP